MIIRHLPYFAIAAEEENLQRAAVRLGISQPALSRRIRDLENELGILLFERVSGRLKLTPLGKYFGDEARRVIDDVDNLIAGIHARSGSGKASFSVSMNERAIAIPSVGAALRRFRRENPAIGTTVKIMSSAQQARALKERQVDVALAYIDEADGAYSFAPIRNVDPFRLVMPQDHPLATKDSISIGDLAGEDLIWPSRDRVPFSYDFLLGKWRACGIEPHITTQVSNSDAALNAVDAGLGLAVIRSSSAERAYPHLRFREVADIADDPIGLSVAWIEQHGSIVLRRFLKLLGDEGLVDLSQLPG